MSLDKFKFNKALLNPVNRKEGISAYLRTRNGGDMLKLVIESHINYFDEIIACYNDCTDNTEAVLRMFEKKYPDKLKVYHYEPKVPPLRSREQKSLLADSVHSMANYSNFALSKTTRKIAVKLDDDHFAVSHNLKEALSYIKKKKNYNAKYTFCGINLMKMTDNEIGICSSHPFAGGVDIEFYPVSEETYYTNKDGVELFIHPKMKKKYLGILYLHLKSLKKCNGFGNYQLERDDNRGNPYVEIIKNFFDTCQYSTLDSFSKTSIETLIKKNSSNAKGFFYSRRFTKKILELTGLDYRTGLDNSRALFFKSDIVHVIDSVEELQSCAQKNSVKLYTMIKKHDIF
ncbi:hypothetical protein [Candidatus Sororendozoicomonas aggregata]|uniref:hypothetical protein n=1 Tax=Candidatus Sororendozoicomonas aggregata TaxID=3073239 RepID=UPI002ED00204